jgi:hypothetical protein
VFFGDWATNMVSVVLGTGEPPVIIAYVMR